MRLDQRPSPVVQLAPAQSFRRALDPLRQQVGIRVGLPVDRQEELGAHQHERRLLLVQQSLQATIDALAEFQKAFFRVVNARPPAVKNGLPCAGRPSRRRMRMEDARLLFPIRLERLVLALGDSADVHFADGVASPLEQSNGFLAQCQEIKPAVAAEQRNQRFDVKMVRDHHFIVEAHRQAVKAGDFRRDKSCQATAHVLPEFSMIQ